MIELVAAVLIITVALLALIGAYSLGYFAINSTAQTTQAGLIANNQLELYAAIPYASIGLDSTTLASVKSTDAYYNTDETALPGSGSDVTISSCGSSAQCSPVQTITGGDHKTYKLETFIRMIANPNVSGSARTEKIITVLVRNMSAGGAKVVVMQTGFDSGLPT